MKCYTQKFFSLDLGFHTYSALSLALVSECQKYGHGSRVRLWKEEAKISVLLFSTDVAHGGLLGSVSQHVLD